MLYIVYTVFLQYILLKKMLLRKFLRKRKYINSTVQYYLKRLHISGSAQFESVLLKVQLCIQIGIQYICSSLVCLNMLILTVFPYMNYKQLIYLFAC